MRGRRRALTREEREKQILNEAIHVFARKGYAATSVNDIVESAGVSRGTFYHYFSCKEDIFLRIIDLYFENLTELLTKNSVRIKRAIFGGGAFLYAWLDYALEFFRFHRDNPQLTHIIYRQAMGQEASFSKRLSDYVLLSRHILASELRMLAERNLIIKCDYDVSAAFITGAALEIIVHYVSTDKDYDMERIAFELVRNQSRALATDLGEVDRILEKMERGLAIKPPTLQDMMAQVPRTGTQ